MKKNQSAMTAEKQYEYSKAQGYADQPKTWKTMTKSEKRERIRSCLFLIPSLIGVLVFFVIPFGIVIRYALIDNPVRQQFVFLDNFKYAFSNSSFLLALKNTGIFTAIAVPMAVLIPLLLALFLSEKLPGKSFFRAVFISPLMVPVASVVLIWQVLFDFNGSVNQFLALFGSLPIDWFKSDSSLLVLQLLFLWKNIGYNMILFMSALGNIPQAMTEAAVLDGANAWQSFRRIKLPYLSSSIVFVAILSIINSFKVFREIYLLTGDHPYEALYMLQHYMNNAFGKLDYQKLSAAALIMCAAVAVIVGIMLIVDEKLGGDVEE